MNKDIQLIQEQADGSFLSKIIAGVNRVVGFDGNGDPVAVNGGTLDLGGARLTNYLEANPAALTFGSTTTLDTTLSRAFSLDLTGDTTMALTGSHRDGNTISLLLCQDATGSRIVTWPSDVVWENDVLPTLTTEALHADFILFYDNGEKWIAVLLAQHLACDAPSTPTSLATDPVSATEVDLTWTAVGGAATYNVYRDSAFVTNVATAYYHDTGRTASTTYGYTVSAVNGYGVSAPCTNVNGLTRTIAPTGLNVAVISATELDLTWDAVTGATSYKVYRNSSLVYSPSTNAQNDTGLTSGTLYHYYVTALNASGESVASSTVDGTTLIGVAAGALQFDGSQNYVTVPYNSGLFPSIVTLEAWINIPTILSHYQFIVGNGDYSTGGTFLDIEQAGDGSKLRFIGNDGSIRGTSNSVVATGRWTHVAVVYDGSNITFYQDGIQDGQSSASGTITDNGLPLGIGKAVSSPPEYFGGSIDEVRISNIARYTTTFVPQPILGSDANTVAYYRFNEGAGTTLTDLTGNGHNGTLMGSPLPTWVEGVPSNTALQFDGSQNYVSVPGSVDLTPSTCTIEFWVKTPDPSSNDAGIVCTWLSDATGFLIYTAASNATVFFGIAGLSVLCGSIADGLWHHIAVTCDGTTLVGFNDGVQTDTAAGVIPATTTELSIGRHTGAHTLNGTIDEVRFSNIVRYSTTFTPQRTLGWDANTVAYWNMEEGQGTTLHDVTGNGHDGTLTGSPVPTWVDGVSKDEALQFDGSQNYVTTSSDAITIPSSDATVEFWFNEPAGTSLSEVSMMEHWGYSGWGWGAYVNNGGTIGFGSLNNGWFSVSTGSYQDGNWHHFAAVQYSGTTYLYLDGVSVASVNGNALAGTSHLCIGGEPGVSWYTKGSIDEVRISNIARYTTTFVPQPILGSDANTVAYYKFDENSGGVAVDYSGNGHIGALTGSPLPQRVTGVSE